MNARSPALSEREFQDMVVTAAQLLGLAVYHTHDSRRSEPGFPDLVIVGATGVLWRELKTDTGRLRPEQLYWLEALQLTGEDVDVWRPAQWPDQIMTELRALGRVSIARPARKPKIPKPR